MLHASQDPCTYYDQLLKYQWNISNKLYCLIKEGTLNTTIPDLTDGIQGFDLFTSLITSVTEHMSTLIFLFSSQCLTSFDCKN